MKRLTLLFTCFLMSMALAIAQNKQVSGTVADESGEPIVGASVIVKGNATIGTVTDVNGKFSMNVPSSATTLVVKYLGMQEQEVAASSAMAIKMQAATSKLDEVIVVAYGNAKKTTYTGSVSVSNATKTLKDIPVTSFESALQGTITGVQVGVPSGQPGAQEEIRIRGVGSYNASNSPLYVIDGVPVNSGDYSLSGYGGSFSIMNTLSPSDIETITVLKDAQAASLYGSRGANGVIMVTTKKGRSGKTKVNLKGSYGINDFAINNRPIATGDQNRELVYEGAYNQAIYNGLSKKDADTWATTQTDKVAPKQDVYSDWIGALTRHATNEKYELNISGGNENTTFYTSLGYSNNLGMYYASWLNGYTGKASISHKSNNWTISVESNFSTMKQGVTPGVEKKSDGYYYALANPYLATRSYLSPNIPIYNADGSYYTGSLFAGSYYNLVADQEKNQSTNGIDKYFNIFSIGYEFIKGLQLKETLSYDYADILGVSITPSDTKDGGGFGGITDKEDYKAKSFYSSLLLTYDKVIAGAHTINALAGWDVNKKNDDYTYAAGTGYASTELWELIAAAKPNEIDGNHYDEVLLSYFGRLNYSYKDKYYVSATLRHDGSSRLGKNTKWGTFWSLSASWRLKEESFLKNVEWINNMKLRASYGTSGTLPSSLYSALATYAYNIAYNGDPASAPSRVDNPNLKWEKNNVFDAGLEATFLDKINLEFDYYNRQTNDMLLDVPLSLTTGFSTTLLNYGGMNNKGVEVSLGVDIFKKGEFKWNSTLNLTHNVNKVTKIYNGAAFVPSTGGATMFLIKEGYSLYSYRARQWAGVDPGTGESMWYKYLDKNGNPVTTATDADIDYSTKTITKDPNQATRLILGKADPDLTGGWRNSLSWKGFDFDLLFTFSLGGHSWDDGWSTATDGYYATPEAISAKQLDRWQNPGDQAPFPKRMFGGGYGNYTSSRWMHSTDHLRLKSLTLGYALPKKILNKAKIENTRLFVAGTNLWTLAAYKDYDPETAIDGRVYYAIPALKGITFGIELGF